MPVGTCCTHFQIYRSSHPEVVSRKVFHENLDSLQENIHAKNPHGYSSVNMLSTCNRTPFFSKNVRISASVYPK